MRRHWPVSRWDRAWSVGSERAVRPYQQRLDRWKKLIDRHRDSRWILSDGLETNESLDAKWFRLAYIENTLAPGIQTSINPLFGAEAAREEVWSTYFELHGLEVERPSSEWCILNNDGDYFPESIDYMRTWVRRHKEYCCKLLLWDGALSNRLAEGDKWVQPLARHRFASDDNLKRIKTILEEFNNANN
jgi:hypothetical protein